MPLIIKIKTLHFVVFALYYNKYNDYLDIVEIGLLRCAV